jgi:hypothetical protein
MTDHLILSHGLWVETWLGLRQRCAGEREATCVWGGQRDGNTLRCTSVIFLNDFPGVRSARLYHVTPPGVTAQVFEILRNRGESIAADIHAHPADWVEQSRTDMEHPIEYRPGLMALILPYFAVGMADLTTIGAHEYLGNLQWRMLPTDECLNRITIEG